MRIGFVRVFVSDVKKSLELYAKTLGMELDYTDDHLHRRSDYPFDNSTEVGLHFLPKITFDPILVTAALERITMKLSSIIEVNNFRLAIHWPFNFFKAQTQ